MAFLDEVIAFDKQHPMNIVVAETDPRVLSAAERALSEGIVNIFIVSDSMDFVADYPLLKEAKVISPSKYEQLEEMANRLAEIRKSKGMTVEQAKELLLTNSLYFGVMLLKMDVADGMIAGATCPTADVLRPALQIIKTAEGTKLVSGAMIIEGHQRELGEHGLLLFADCAINPEPNEEELAHIAISSASTFESLVQEEAKVAMVSFSTKGSAKHPNVDKMHNATKLAKELKPDLKIDGELQADAALIPSVAEKKAKDSAVAGKANVLVFPDLGAGNSGYKLVQRFGGANVYGPICQGIALPINDLSRGATVDDIFGTIAITGMQAYAKKHNLC